MSAFGLKESLARAEQLTGRGKKRRRDRGGTRFDVDVDGELTRLLHGRDKPVFTELHRELVSFCEARGLRAPTRSSVYNAVPRVEVPALAWEDLPEAVRTSLYNVAPEHALDTVPGDQVVFHAFNYGAARALSFASALPWLCLVRADARRGWRPKSHALLRAVMRYRGL